MSPVVFARGTLAEHAQTRCGASDCSPGPPCRRLFGGERGRAGEISLLRLPHNNRLVPLEKLPFKAREEALAQMVSGFAIALDLGLILIHQHPPGKKQLNLTGRIRDLMNNTIRVENSFFGERGPLQGALISSAITTQNWLCDTGGSSF